MIERIERPPGLGAPNGYSHVAVATGRLVVVSGQLPVDEDGELVSTDARRQAEQVFVNIGRALAAAGADPADVVRLGYYLTNLDDLPKVRAAREEFFGEMQRPASTLVQVSGLVLPGAHLEVDALAVVG